MAETIEFGSRSAARTIRNNPKFKPFLADEDDARTSTVVLKSSTPEPALQDLQGEAADSLAHKAEEYGQAPLSKTEKKQIDFSSGRANVMHARSVKAIAHGKGVDDWTAFYDPTLSVDEHRSVMESALQDDRGRAGLGRDRDGDEATLAKVAQAHHQRKQDELPHAKRAGFGGDPDAQAFVRDQGPTGEVFDVRYSRTDDGRLQGSGEDYDRLQDVHEARSQRARTLDGMRQAPVTRDPYQWVNAPSRWDFIGVDDVRPDELHAARSPQARALDERSAAPLTDDREKWAYHPDRYDYKGVDDVDPERLHASRSQRARTIDEREIAPIADSKQQWATNPARWDLRGVDMPATYGPLGSTPIPDEQWEQFAELDDAPADVHEPAETERDVDRRVKSAYASLTAGLAGGQEADEAFLQAEQERAAGFGAEPGAILDTAAGDVDDGLPEAFRDDRDQQGSMIDFGMEADATMHREAREWGPTASAFGVDDRELDESGDAQESDQSGLEVYGAGARKNEDLTGF